MAGTTAQFVRKHYRAHERFMQRAMTHLFVLYRTYQELLRELGEEGTRHWLRANCPEIRWDEIQQLFDKARAVNLRGIEQRLGRN